MVRNHETDQEGQDSEPAGPREVRSFVSYFHGIAREVATRSKHPRSQHGAVLISPGPPPIIRSTGYNGAPAGFPDGEVDWSPGMTWTSRDWTIHAEENALLQAGWERAKGGTMFITALPCPRCYLRMVHCGIKAIYAGDATYSKMEADMMLLQHLASLAEVPIYLYNEDDGTVLRLKTA